jgi:hypothetical protein
MASSAFLRAAATEPFEVGAQVGIGSAKQISNEVCK